MKRLTLALVFSLSMLSWTAGAQAAMSGNSGLFTGKDAGAAIEAAIARQDGISDVEVSISQIRDEDIIAQGAGGVVADISDLSVDKAHNHWDATLVMQENGQNLAPIRLTGRYEQMVSVPVLRRRVAPGEVIAQDDIDWDREPAQHVRKNTVTDPRDLIGKSPKHVISQSRSVRFDEIASPAIVARGAKVTLLFRLHNIEIKTYGEALESGAKGDVIRVRNITSKNVVQGTVESPEYVSVSSPESNAAEAIP